MNTNFLKASDIANILKISKALSYRLIAQGEIPSVRFGKVVRVKQQDLENFITRNQNDGVIINFDSRQKHKTR
ncbi:MAG: helix-turn-helix domain-containing protein [Anaerolineales bacterium]